MWGWKTCLNVPVLSNCRSWSLNNKIHLVADRVSINPIYLQQADYFGLEIELRRKMTSCLNLTKVFRRLAAFQYSWPYSFIFFLCEHVCSHLQNYQSAVWTFISPGMQCTVSTLTLFSLQQLHYCLFHQNFYTSSNHCGVLGCSSHSGNSKHAS